LNAKHHFREAEIVAQAGRKFSVTVATNMAGRGVDVILGGNPEGLAARDVLGQGIQPEDDNYTTLVAEAEVKYHAMCASEGDEVRALGGLYVLGSERHDSRRIDNQLRGRSGRQGDPGESRFFLSLEDDLLRLFATGAVSWVMGRTMPDDVPIEAKMVSKAIERAQNTVEGRNAEIRKDVLKYDEVMNEQRKVIYGRRQQVIDGEDMHDMTVALIEDVLSDVVENQLDSEFNEEWDLRALLNELMNYYPVSLNEETLLTYEERDDIIALVLEDALTLYEAKCETFAEGLDTAKEIERDVMLQVVDQRWREHLSDMDYLRDGIYLRQVAQQDPLTAWQKEGYELFEALLVTINKEYVRFITRVEIQEIAEAQADAEAQDEGLENAVTNVDVVATGGAELPVHGGSARPASVKTASKEGDKIGRNEPCWCGSGRKFKQCHGRP